MSEQIKLFEQNNHEEKLPKGPKRQMGFAGENMREFVNAPAGKVCAKCEQPLERGLPVVKFAPLVNGKPDISRLEYFHRQDKGSCLDRSEP